MRSYDEEHWSWSTGFILLHAIQLLTQHLQYAWNRTIQTQTNDFQFNERKEPTVSWMLHTSKWDYGLVYGAIVFSRRSRWMDGRKKDGETWDAEWQPEFSHRLILTSIHPYHSLLLALWWRQGSKGTLSVGSCPEAPDLKQDEGYSVCPEGVRGEGSILAGH